MKKIPLQTYLTLLFLFTFAVVSGAEPAARKTIERAADPIIISGDNLPGFHGVDIKRVRVYASRGGALRPIPYQIDERGADGDLIFPGGPGKSADADGGLFDANDELILMAIDLGDDSSERGWPEAWTASARVEATDPLDGSKGWAFVFAFDDPPPRSPVDYVSISDDGSHVKARNFSVSFSDAAPIGFDGLSLTEAGGGNGKNTVDRLKIRVKTVVRMINLTINKTENDFESELIAFIDGPVRVIRRTRNVMRIFWKIASPASMIDNVFYRDSFEFPTEVTIPFDIGAIASEFSMRVSIDGNENQNGKIFINEHNLDGVTIDGVASEAEKNLDLSPYKWSVVYGTNEGNEGAWINRLEFDDAIEAVPYLHYVDDAGADEPPENVPGQFGALGYNVSKLETLTKGSWRLTSIMYNCPRYNRGDEVKYLDVLDHPLEITVK